MKLVISVNTDLDALLLRSYLLSLGFVDKTKVDTNIKNTTYIIVARNYFFGTYDYLKFSDDNYLYYDNFVKNPQMWLKCTRARSQGFKFFLIDDTYQKFEGVLRRARGLSGDMRASSTIQLPIISGPYSLTQATTPARHTKRTRLKLATNRLSDKLAINSALKALKISGNSHLGV